MNNAVRARQRILAVVLPITAALYIAAEGVNPKGTDQLITTTATALKVLPIAARHTTQLYISGSLTELALGAVAVSYAAIAILVRKARRDLGHDGRVDRRDRCFLRGSRERPGWHQPCCRGVVTPDATGGCTVPCYFVQFRARSCVPRFLRSRPIRRTGPYGSGPLAKPRRPPLARGTVPRRV